MADLRIRDVPPEVMAQLKSKAALAGKFLNDYMIDLLRKAVNRKATRKQPGAAS